MWIEKNGPVYRIRDVVRGKKVTIQTGYPTKTSAKNGMVQFKAEALQGNALLPRGGTITLAEFVEEWWPHYEKSLKPTAALSEGNRVRNHILALLGHLALDELDGPTVQQWVADLGAGIGPWPTTTRGKRKPLAPKSISNCHGLLHTICGAAIAAKRIRLNPCSSTKLPRREPKEMRFLSDPEIGRLIAALPPHWRPLVMLLIATGLRWGEAIGLRAGRVDLLATRPRLTVVEQLQELAGTGELVFQSPKTAKGRRTVSFTKQVALLLTPLLAGKRSDEVVFTAPRGGMVRTRNFRRIWVQACEEAGLVGLRIHDLRHTHAAILISAGRPLSAISRRLGHSSIAVTDLLYGHLREEVDEGILAAIEEAMSGVRAEDLEAELDEELVDVLADAA
ncbi:tyrosine-type recombinase/integrase [Micromonospora haikouensis]|uniref:tyrosine-type recombinase/integrase n=1 Tax=Micromonospora haikouensis TaxID=686309 RepID=UPI0037AC45B5